MNASAPSLKLSPSRVDIWYAQVPASLPADVQTEWESWLTPEEQTRHKRFMFDKDRRRFLVTRALVRSTLCQYAPLDPAAWRFDANEWGRPQLSGQHAAQSTWRFNVTHTDSVVVMAIGAERELGIDTESELRRAPLDVADRFFSPEEAEALRALPPGQQENRFWDLWTFKESYIKARGMGLSLPLDGFSFGFMEDRRISIRFAPSIDDQPERWQFWQFQLDDSHRLSVCVERQSAAAPEFVFRQVLPEHPWRPMNCPARYGHGC